MKTQANLITLPAGAPSTNGLERQVNLNPDSAISSFLAARDRLRQRERELEAEISSIRQLLRGETDGLETPMAVPLTPPPPPPPPPPPVPNVPPPAAPRHSNAGLRQAVTDLLKQKGALTKDQIVELLTAQNFQFFGKPKPALDPVLYGKKFQRNGKLFELAANP